MRGLLSGLGLWILLSVAPSPAVAGEVVEFKDGRYLAVRSYDVHGDFVRLDVDRGSFLIIPASSIDTIRRNRVAVFVYEGGGRQDPRTAKSTPPTPRSVDRPARGEALAIGG